MKTKTKASEAQLQARLGLRSCNAAQPHKNQRRAEKRPGSGDRRRMRQRAIADQCR